jgi:hypothetical protein
VHCYGDKWLGDPACRGRKQAEAARMIAHEFGAIFVDPARGRSRFVRTAESDAWRRKRQYRRFDAVLVHGGEHLLRCPFELGPADFTAPGACDPVAVFGQLEWRDDVAVHDILLGSRQLCATIRIRSADVDWRLTSKTALLGCCNRAP